MVPSPRVLETTQEPPRVLRSDIATRQSPRVLEQNINKGTNIKKKFGKNIYKGKVTKYDNHSKLYYVEYSDGDSEEMTAKEVQKYKCTTNYTAVAKLRSRKA
jgi:small nuclear ribonucleoprotein (snRNP)-like protein